MRVGRIQLNRRPERRCLSLPLPNALEAAQSVSESRCLQKMDRRWLQ